MAYIGYVIVSLYNNGKPCNEYVHRLLAKAFIPNPENKPCVNHIDGNKSNNSLSNLEWVTYKENTKHAYNVLNVKEYPNFKEHLKKCSLKTQTAKELNFERNYNKHYIRCVETGEEFESQAAAGRKYNVTRAAIHTALALKSVCKGLHFVWAVEH